MNVILCSVSLENYNDHVVNGFVHYALSSFIDNQAPYYAVYQAEEKQIAFRKGEIQIDTIKPAKRIEKLTKYSSKLGCVHSLLERMSENDQLNVVSLSDLGETAEEAELAYHWILDKRIGFSLFDIISLNPDILMPSSRLSEYQEVLIHNIIDGYYKRREKGPVIPEAKISKLMALESAKKK